MWTTGGPLPQPFLMATVHPQVPGNIEWSGEARQLGLRVKARGYRPSLWVSVT